MTGFFGGGSSAPPYFLSFRSGLYYSHYLDSSAGTVALTANQLYGIPIFIGVNQVVTEIGIEVTTAGSASTVIRLGIYGESSGVPGNLIVDAGTVTADSNAVKAITISQTLAPGWYFLCCFSDSTATVRCATIAARNNIFGMASSSAALTTMYIRALAYTTLPASFGSPTAATSVTPPRVWLRNV